MRALIAFACGESPTPPPIAFRRSSKRPSPRAACCTRTGSSVMTGLEKHGYRHRITFLKGRKESASELLPRVHRVVSLLKRWLLGTHQGAVSRTHLDYYLDEFAFRFNRRTSRHRG